MRADAQANRDRILAAAEAVFSEAGEAGSTEEIARRAGVGIGTVFRHFPTKQELIEATVVRHFDELTSRARALSSAHPGAALRELIEVMVGTGSTKILLLGLLNDAGAGGVPELAVQASQRLRRAVGALLRRAQKAGTIRPDVSVDEVFLLVRGLALASAQRPAKNATQRKALDIVLAGLAPG
ncbi:MAG TPA: TetR/AcrR family transcriptional regulator [Jatrophihabitantaceae bacterium]|jgi:AcrR family transcriptional regulator